MKADSGASKMYLRPNNINYLIDQKNLVNGPTTALPNNAKLQASTQGIIPLENILKAEALVYPILNNESLLSIGQLCNMSCVAIFDKYKLHMI